MLDQKKQHPVIVESRHRGQPMSALLPRFQTLNEKVHLQGISGSLTIQSTIIQPCN